VPFVNWGSPAHLFWDFPEIARTCVIVDILLGGADLHGAMHSEYVRLLISMRAPRQRSQRPPEL